MLLVFQNIIQKCDFNIEKSNLKFYTSITVDIDVIFLARGVPFVGCSALLRLSPPTPARPRKPRSKIRSACLLGLLSSTRRTLSMCENTIRKHFTKKFKTSHALTSLSSCRPLYFTYCTTIRGTFWYDF